MRMPKIAYQTMTALLLTVGQTSDSVRLGFERGFDSGEMMDSIYQNRPSGRYGIGTLADWIYLNQIGCRGLRGRKSLLKDTLRQELEDQRRQGQHLVIVDIASGPGTYLVEALAEDGRDDVIAICRDLDQHGLQRGRELAATSGVTNIRYEQGNALDEASLRAISRPTIVVSSGFYEILMDDELIRTSMRIVRQILSPGGVFIFTTQVHHPQLELIANVLPNREGKPWIMKNRSIEEVAAWAREAGFAHVETTMEPNGLFGVSAAT
ncbi:MAG TPA: class I SAM-dependent methyltransferase family protein [Ardenticatenaceae bacterium]|nr:class I SAM-dependent methyltransferase family protein [Ardenticatenaceae bacterium]